MIAESKMELQIKMKQKTDEKGRRNRTRTARKKKKRMTKEISDVLNSSNDFSSSNPSSMGASGDFSVSMPDISSIDINV